MVDKYQVVNRVEVESKTDEIKSDLCLAVDFDKSVRENFAEPSAIEISIFQAVECIVISWKLKSKESDLK